MSLSIVGTTSVERPLLQEAVRPPEHWLRGQDYALLVFFCTCLFGAALLGGRFLTMHEAVLPQSAKEMYATGEWLVPTSAGRPWLERPPLPQWITILCAHLVGRFDQEWVVRLPAAIVATLSVLVVAQLGAFWFRRSVGIIAGLCLATSLEFTRYAWLAEQDIYLSLLVTTAVAFFGFMEFRPRASLPTEKSFFGTRPLSVLIWFLLLGLTNLAKGLVFGSAMALLPVIAFLLWNASLHRIQRYVWFWGWLAGAAVALAWPLAVSIRYPDVVDLWHYDLIGRLSGAYTAINEPVWYYPVNLPLIVAPWFITAILGFATTARNAFRERFSPERFLWCWGLVPMTVFSIPGGKHHHYMLACIAPWAILSALGLIELRRWSLAWPAYLKTPMAGALFVGLPIAAGIGWAGPYLEGPGWIPLAACAGVVVVASLSAWGIHHRKDVVAAATLFGIIGIAYVGGLFYTGRYLDECRGDSLFFQQAKMESQQRSEPLFVNADLKTMDVFRILFYLGDQARSVHNLTFLRDEAIQDSTILVLTRARDMDTLRNLGQVREIGRSAETRREGAPGDRFALFELTFDSKLVRVSQKPRISPMQAMDREQGPFLGGRF